MTKQYPLPPGSLSVAMVHNLSNRLCPMCGTARLAGVTNHDVSKGDMVRLRCGCGWSAVRPLKTNNPAVILEPSSEVRENNERIEHEETEKYRKMQ